MVYIEVEFAISLNCSDNWDCIHVNVFGVCLFVGLEPVTGALEWSTGVEHWSGALEWSTGVDYWSGLLEWPVAFACHKNMYV